MEKEKVLVVQNKLLNLPAQNYIQSRATIEEIMDICAQDYFFMDRDKAERLSHYKQLVPYVTVINQGQVLCLERTKAQGEARLHGKISLGVGGHINPIDHHPEFTSLVHQAMLRELREELWFGTGQPQLLGLINDDSNPVGRVHLAIHYILPVDCRPEIRETDKMRGTWLALDQLEALRPRMETWSQIALTSLESCSHL